MKTRITFVAAVAMGAVSLMTSCSNEALDSATDGVMLEAEVSDIAKSRTVIEGTTLPAGSEYGLYVFQDYNAVSGNIKMNANSTSTGYLLTNNSEVKVCAYYPYDEKNRLEYIYMDVYPGTTDYLRTTGSEYYTKSNPKASITLHHALARVKFNVTVAAEVTNSYNVILNTIGNVYETAEMSLLSDEVWGMTIAGDYKLPNPINGTVKAGETLSTEVLLVPQNISNMLPKVSVLVDKESKEISTELINATASGMWESGKEYTYNITINEGKRLSVSSATIEEWGEVEELKGVTAEEFVVNANGHEYVDLGLPSGTLWATCNVGTSSPYESGDYFAWGETTTKDTYTESNYNYSDTPDVLPLEADVAHLKWGGDWRLPVRAEIAELCKECDWVWEGSGYMVVSKYNGNSIFMPNTGFIATIKGMDDRGYYWCSSTYYGDVYGLNFSSNWVYSFSPFIRTDGMCVRPVIHK